MKKPTGKDIAAKVAEIAPVEPVTIIGQEQCYLPCSPGGEITGDMIKLDEITKKVCGQRQFWKIYLFDFLAILGIVDSRQLDVLVYILEHTNSATNLYIGTWKKIQDDTGVSAETVRRIMKKLQDNGFLKKVQNGVYGINPKIMMKGNEHKRQILLTYQEVDQPEAAAYSHVQTQQQPIATVADKMAALPALPGCDGA